MFTALCNPIYAEFPTQEAAAACAKSRLAARAWGHMSIVQVRTQVGSTETEETGRFFAIALTPGDLVAERGVVLDVCRAERQRFAKLGVALDYLVCEILHTLHR